MKEKLKRLICKAFYKLYFIVYIFPVSIISLICHKELYDANPYFEGAKRKSLPRRFFDQLLQIVKYGYPEHYYFMYGLDCKVGKEYDDYVNSKTFMDRRNYLNYLSHPCDNSCCILRNKLYFDIFAKSFGFHTPSIIAFTTSNVLYILNGTYNECSMDKICELPDMTLFCKETGGECGVGVFILKIRSHKLFFNDQEIATEQLFNKISGRDYIFQETVVQHCLMSKLYSKSINTIRLVTVRSLKDGKIRILPSILRIGSNGSYVDNTSQGGIAIGFNLEDGSLNKYGYYKPEFGFKTKEHPNTGIVFDSFKIPFIEEIKAEAIRFHSKLADIHSIGWDIAVGKEGPIFIEGNDNWEINGHQDWAHGLKKEFKEYFFK